MVKTVRITITAKPEIRQLLLDEQYRRRAQGRDDWSMERMIIDAIIVAYGEHLPNHTSAS